MDELSHWLGILGTIAFAVTAVLSVTSKSIDLFGASVLAVMTAVGGGTVRDMITYQPVFWSIDDSYIWIALASTLIIFYFRKVFIKKRVNKLILYIDAIGISLFSIQGLEKVWNLGYGLPLAPIILGIMTAIGGGLMRDVLAGRQNLLMSKELYAIPVLIGCVIYSIFLTQFPDYKVYGAIFCVVLIFVIRVVAIEKKLSVPKWLISS
jgi:uncharacterized membrane protein YeiH